MKRSLLSLNWSNLSPSITKWSRWSWRPGDREQCALLILLSILMLITNWPELSTFPQRNALNIFPSPSVVTWHTWAWSSCCVVFCDVFCFCFCFRCLIEMLYSLFSPIHWILYGFNGWQLAKLKKDATVMEFARYVELVLKIQILINNDDFWWVCEIWI